MFNEFKFYFQQVDQIQQFLGNNKSARDAAEIILYISSMTKQGRTVLRRYVYEWLLIPYDAVDRAVRFLKDKNLLRTRDKAYTVNKEGISNLDLTEDEKFQLYASLDSLDEWYSKKNEEVRYQWLSYIHAIQNAVGIGIETKHCTRRLLARCLCFNECSGCGYTTACVIKRDMKRLNKNHILKIVEKDTYVDKMLSYVIPRRRFIYRGITIRNKAQQIYLGKLPEGLNESDTYSGIWVEARKIAEEAKKHNFRNQWELNNFLYRAAVIDPSIEKFGSYDENVMKSQIDEDVTYYINRKDELGEDFEVDNLY